MKVYQGHSASPGLVMGQVSRLERWHENFATGPFNAEREQRLLENAVRTAQRELDGMADRSGPTEQAIFLFQSMMLEDEGFMNEVKFQIKAGISAAEAMYRAGNRYAEQLAAMEDNAYMQLRSADILDAARRVVNVLTNRPRVWLALDHPVILAAEMLMPSDLFSVPAGMILGIITSEGNKQSHAAIIARAMHIPCVVQVGRRSWTTVMAVLWCWMPTTASASWTRMPTPASRRSAASVSCSGRARKPPASASCPTGQRMMCRLSSWPTATGRRILKRRCRQALPVWACCAAAI